MERTYFAYGSNLDVAQMQRRCPGARPLRTAVLGGYRLAFTGFSAGWGGAVATLVPDLTARVQGRLFAMTAEDFDALDRCEGHPLVYQRGRLRVRDDLGRFRRAETYIAPLLDGLEARPSEAYLGQIWRAYRALDFDLFGLVRAATAEASPARRASNDPPWSAARRALAG